MNNKCEEIYCPWVRDSEDLNHYCCLRCGTERWVNRSQSNDWFIWILLFLIAVIIVVAMG
jgi:hypothetical protein